MTMIKRLWIQRLILALLLFVSLSSYAADVPIVTRHITDQTNTLSEEEVIYIDQKLQALEQNKGAQLVVLMVPTTAPQDIESYALAVFEANKIGRKKTDDGILLLIAKDDRRNRIEVGYGLEGAVPDAIAAQILRESLAPNFRQGNFFAGIDAGVDQLIKLINGETLPPPSETDRSEGKSTFSFIVLAIILFGIMSIFRNIVFGIVGRKRLQNTKLRLGVGAVLFSILLLFSDLGFSLSDFLFAPLFGALVFALPPGKKSRFRYSFGGSSGSRSGGSSRRSSGGFSGGGGRSGGGGASGSW